MPHARRALLFATLMITTLAAFPAGRSREPGGGAAAPQFTVPSGFAVEQVLGPTASGSVLAITFDAAGRLVYGRERGPVIRLLDLDGDGRADGEQLVADGVANCQGLEFHGTTLLAACGGPQGPGLYRLPDPDGDGAADGVQLIAAASDPMAEHGPHAPFFGPDGWLYWIFGNFSGLGATPDPRSPYAGFHEEQLLPTYADPRGHASAPAPGGTIVRKDLSRADSDWQLVAGGFRNAYDAAFDLDGELFTFDSDMEWDIGLPWYRPVRTVHVVPGGEYGWRSGSNTWPAYYPDSLPPLSDVGRGSPTGVAFYQGDRFPEEYRGMFLQGDWSRGRILAGFLTREGASYRERSTEFLTGTPLNVTDLDVGPDGAVYFSKGGRQTEGGIYRVVYTRSLQSKVPPNSWLDAVLSQAQPRSAWARAATARARDLAGGDWEAGLVRVARDTAEPAARRARALELLQVFGPRPGVPLLTALSTDAPPELRGRATYYLGLHATDDARRAIAERLADADALVRRRAAEALVRTRIDPADPLPFDAAGRLLPLLGDSDRFVRFSARAALERVNRNRWSAAALETATYPAAAEALVALARTAGRGSEVRAVLERVQTLIQAAPPDRDLLTLLRASHLAMIRTAGVEHSSVYRDIGDRLLERFPSGHHALDREIARTFAFMRTRAAVPALAAALEAAGDSREQQIHYVLCLRALGGQWSERERQAVTGFFARTQEQRWRGGASFDGYLRYLWRDVLALLPEAERAAAREAVPSLESDPSGRPFRVLLTGAYSNEEMREYLQFDPMAYSGDADKGRLVYEKAYCANCHRHGDLGQEAGPDLTDLARRFERSDIVDAILTPSKSISDQWAAVEITTRQKQALAGVVTAETDADVTLLTVTGQRTRILKSDIVSRTSAGVSPMPEGLLNALSLGEVADLFAFLEWGR